MPFHTVRRVMQLKNQIAPGFDQLRLSRRQQLRKIARTIASQKLAWHTATMIMRIQRKRRSQRLSCQPTRTRLAHADNNVMRMHPVARTHFRQSHPRVLLEMCRQNHILIRQHAGNGHIKGLRHFESHSRLADRPTLNPMNRFRRIFQITRR